MRTTTTAFEEFSVELFYEIFSYFQFHEVFNIFSNLNGRFAAIVNKMAVMPIYMGLNGMGIAVTEFYRRYLSQSNVCNRLISLCISDTLAINNGLWLTSHLPTFTNLRHLSLIDIKRSSFELILNTSSANTSLLMFSVRYSYDYRAVYTFKGVPEGAYYNRIFHLFPSLHVCELRFWRYISNTLDNEIILPLNQAFMSIETSLLNLKSIAIRECSFTFLKHLLGHLPQLYELSFGLSSPWLPDKHPLINDDDNRMSSIDKCLLPKLRRLKISSKYNALAEELIDRLFDREVLFSLTNFTLVGMVTGPDVARKLLSMLCPQCSYTLIVRWAVKTTISLSDTSVILLDTFRQLKGRVPIELELLLYHEHYCIEAFTVRRIDKSVHAYGYLNKNSVRAQSRWPYTMSALNKRSAHTNEIILSNMNSQISNEFLSYLPRIISWHQITSLGITNPFNLSQLRFLVSKMVNLRTLELDYDFYCDYEDDSKKLNTIDLLTDTSLCNMLMSNGLQKLSLHVHSQHLYTIDIAYLVVKQLPHLEIIELNCFDSQVPETLHTLMNGLPKLNFIIFHGALGGVDELHSKLRDLQKYNMRAYRIDYCTQLPYDVGAVLYVWV